MDKTKIKQMRYAIIGLGFIYPRHKKCIEETGGEIILTCDIDPSKRPNLTNWRDLLEFPLVDTYDCAVICTPNYLHAKMVKEFLKVGKKVLCEKPLTIDGTKGLEGVNTVLQLRHHPEIKHLRATNAIVLARMFRDESYWKGWKGDKEKSGGILYNLGIHYIDLLIYLLGEPKKIIKTEISDKLATGTVEFSKGLGMFHVEILDDKKEQARTLITNGREIQLSNQDNLSYEDLHKEVYEDFIKGEGITLAEASKSLNLVKDLLEFNANKH